MVQEPRRSARPTASFARVRLSDGAAREAVLVADRAVATDQDRRFVWVVGPDGKVAVPVGEARPARRRPARRARGLVADRTGWWCAACSGCARAPRSAELVAMAAADAVGAESARREGRRREDRALLHRPADLRGACSRSSSSLARRRSRCYALPIAQYPEIVPPTVVVSAHYPGANAEGRRRHGRRADRAAGQRRRGHALHVVAVDTTTAATTLTVTFELGTDLDMAQVLVQNRVAHRGAAPARGRAAARRHRRSKTLARPPAGRAASSRPTAATTSSTSATTPRIQVRDELARLPGVGDVHALRRARLQHARLARPETGSPRADLTAGDVVRALARAERAGRRRRARPAARRRARQASSSRITARGRLATRRAVRRHRRQDRRRRRASSASRDVARVELGAATTRVRSLHRQRAGRRAWPSSSSPARTRSTPPTPSRQAWRS